MALITTSALIDTREVAKRIKTWLAEKGFETRVLATGSTYAVKARKSSAFRAVVGADRALEVGIRHWGGETQVEVRQGSWKTNAWSNTAWLVVTGGANLGISAWSVLVQRDLESFVRSTLAELAGVREVDFAEAVETQSGTHPGSANPATQAQTNSELDDPTPRIAAAEQNVAIERWKALAWVVLPWLVAALLMYAAVKMLVLGHWKGAPMILLAGLSCLPPAGPCRHRPQSRRERSRVLGDLHHSVGDWYESLEV